MNDVCQKNPSASRRGGGAATSSSNFPAARKSWLAVVPRKDWVRDPIQLVEPERDILRGNQQVFTGWK
jgi:hypothetical protein